MLKTISAFFLSLLLSVNAYADFEDSSSFYYLTTVNSAYDLEDDETVGN